MVKFEHDLWILSKTGLVIFVNVEEGDVDPDLFGGMMAVLNLYAESFSEGGISHFYINENRFSILDENDLLFVSRSSKRVKTSKLKEEQKVIAVEFFKMYSPEFFLNWGGGDISLFSKFKSVLKN